jgi:pimeloyl-ACP methyl ester carboxylesterase
MGAGTSTTGAASGTLGSVTTAVLVHGGWHSASCWDLVRAELTADGIRSVAPQLPMTSTLDVDAAVVRNALDSLGDDAVVVAHSWGGSPVTLGASGAPNVRHLIYLAAFMIEAGRPSLVDMRELPPMASVQIGPEVAVVNPEFAYDAFYHDCDPRVAAECTAQLRPFACAGWDRVETPVPPVEPLPDDLRRLHAGPRDEPGRPARHGSRGRGSRDR